MLKSGVYLSKSWAYISHGISCYYRGLFKEAEKYLTKGIAFSEKINYFSGMAVGHQWLGHTFFDIREFPITNDYSKAANLRKQVNCSLLP